MAENYVGNAPSANTLNLLGDYSPVGSINWFHGAPDASWLRLIGQTVAKASYPDLWNYAQSFLTADQVANPGLYKDIDANNFALPNFSGMFIRSTGQVDASHVAAGLGVKQADDNLAHKHGIDRYNNPGANTNRISGGGALQAAALADDVANSGGTEARPINIALNACVKALKMIVVAPAVGTTTMGQLIQSVSHIRTDWYAPATIAIPGDDTIPQITEGQEYLSVANFAPMFVGSRVRLTVQFYWTAAGIIQMISALFRSGTANALASMAQVNPAGDFETIHTYEYEFIATSTAPFTYSFRSGGNAGGASPVRMNGRGARMLGGTTQSYLRIDEYAPGAIVLGTPVPAAPGFLAGFTLSNNVTDATNDIDIAIGKCRATGDVADIWLPAALTKQLDAAWAVGSNAGMRASGAAIADTTYHIFAINGAFGVDIAADTSVTGANMVALTGATNWRRIGSIMRVAGVITGFVQQGDYFRRKATVLDANLTNPGVAAITQTMSVPLGINVFVEFHAFAGAGAVAQVIIFSDPAANDEAGSATLAPLGMLGSGSGNLSYSGWFSIRTNTAAQIRLRSNGSDGSTSIRLATRGWIDRRGQDDI